MTDAEDDDCTCRAPAVSAYDEEPPNKKRDSNCPVHGSDPDRLRDQRMDDRITGVFQNDFPEYD